MFVNNLLTQISPAYFMRMQAYSKTRVDNISGLRTANTILKEKNKAGD